MLDSRDFSPAFPPGFTKPPDYDSSPSLPIFISPFFFLISRNDLARPDNRIPLVVTRFFPTNDSTNKPALAVEQGL